MTPLYAGWGRLMRALVRWLCAGIQSPPPMPEPGPGPTSHVYVTRGDSTFLALAVLSTLFRSGISDIYFLGGIRLWWYRPWQPLWRALRPRSRPSSSAEGPAAVLAAIRQQFGRRAYDLATHVAAGRSVAVVLPVARSRGGLLSDWADYAQVLLMLQPALAHPIVLWPHVLATREQSGHGGAGWLDWLLGDSRQPGWLRHWTMLLVLRHGSLLRAEPIVLTKWPAGTPHAAAEEAPGAAAGEGTALAGAETAKVEGNEGQPGQAPANFADDETAAGAAAGKPSSVRARARALRRELHRRMDEAQRVVAGPALGNYEQMAQQVLADSQLRLAIGQVAQASGQSEPMLEVEAARRLRRMAAHYDVRAIRSMEHMLYLLFNRIYDGVVVDEPGLARVIAASRRAPVVFCPSHKSHIDYLVLSFVLWTHGIAPPHVAAGANLDFFPVGALFRRCGAFFLRRSFRDDPAYAALMRAYIAYLVRTGTSIEFFLEGTRSRSGKLLPPKFGLLRMILDAYAQGAREDIVFAPVSIDYERIMEAASFRSELKGASKRAETFRGLLGAMGVLGSRYGRLHVQFGEPISLKEWAKGRPLQQDIELREQTERLGLHILHEVAAACSVTPTNIVASVLLGHVGRGIAQGSLIARSLAILDFLAASSARLVEALQPEEGRVGVVLEATQKLVDEGLVTFEQAGAGDQERIFFVPDEARITLDYHKNAIMNHFGVAAMVSRALLAKDVAEAGGQPAYAAAFAHGQFLAQLFGQEFTQPIDRDFRTRFDETLGALSIFGLVEVQSDSESIRICEPQTVGHLSALLTSYLEGYRVAIEAALDLRAIELSAKDFVARALERARRAWLEGIISRPEAASRTLMETALTWLLEQGLLVRRTQDKRHVLRFGAAGQMRLTQTIEHILLLLS